jgi:hypothetical protein
VLRIMFVSKLKTAAIALVAAGVVASNAGAYAYRKFLQPPADPRLATAAPDLATAAPDLATAAPDLATAAADTDDPPPAKRLTDADYELWWQDHLGNARRGEPKRLTDKEYELWRHQIHDSYKKKMGALLAEVSQNTLDDHLDKAAATTSQIEATAREWRWMLNHPGAKSMSMPASSGATFRKDQLRFHTMPPGADAVYYVQDQAAEPAANPPRGGVRITQPAAAPPPPTTGGPAAAPHPIPAPSPDNQPLAPVPPVPPVAPGALAAPVPGEPPPPPTMPDVPAPPGTPPPAMTHPGPAERLETLERKVDQILKALEQLHGANSNTRNLSPNRQ